MSFSLAKPGGYALGDAITPTALTTIDENAYNALDKRSGQTDTLASVVQADDAGRIIASLRSVDAGATHGIADGILLVDGNLTAARDFTFTNTGAVLGDIVRIRNTHATFALTVKNAAAATLIILGGTTGETTWADFQFNGSAWTLWAGPPTKLAPLHGGTGQDNSAANGITKYTAGVPSIVPIGAGDAVGTTGTQTLSGKTLTAPTITGAVTITGFTSTTTTSSDGKVVTIDALSSVQTTDATVTSAYTSDTLADESVHVIDAIITAIKSDGTAAAVYKRNYCGRRDGGTWTQLVAVSDNMTEETSSAWDVTVEVNSNTFRVRVTGVAANTIRWGVAVRIQSTVP